MSKIRANKKGWDAKYSVQFPHWKMEKSEWIIEEYAHEPLVTKELWEKANAVRKQGPRKLRGPHQSPYLLSGLMVCGSCGFNFQGQSPRSKGKRYHRYVCGGYNDKRICDFVLVRRDGVEDFVLQSIRTTFNNPNLLKRVEMYLQQRLASGPATAMSEKTDLEKQLKLNEEKMDRIIDAIESGNVAPAMEKRIASLKKERKELINALAQSATPERPGDCTADVVASVADFVLKFDQIFSVATMSERKDLVRRCVRKIVVEHEPRIVRCFVRKMPMVSPVVEDLQLEPINEQTATPEKESPLFIVGVAGAGLEPATFGL